MKKIIIFSIFSIFIFLFVCVNVFSLNKTAFADNSFQTAVGLVALSSAQIEVTTNSAGSSLNPVFGVCRNKIDGTQDCYSVDTSSIGSSPVDICKVVSGGSPDCSLLHSYTLTKSVTDDTHRVYTISGLDINSSYGYVFRNSSNTITYSVGSFYTDIHGGGGSGGGGDTSVWNTGTGGGWNTGTGGGWGVTSTSSGTSTLSSSSLTLMSFNPIAKDNGTVISFTANVQSSTAFPGTTYTFACDQSKTSPSPAQTSSISVDIIKGTTHLTGLVSEVTPRVGNSTKYWCELLGPDGTPLDGANMTDVTPPTVSGVPYVIPRTITSTSASIEIDFATGTTISTPPNVTYSDNPAPTSGGTTISMSSIGTLKYSVQIPGLSSSTTYYYTVKDGTDDTFVYGDVGQSFTTTLDPFKLTTIVYTGASATVIHMSDFNVKADGEYYGLVGCAGGWKITKGIKADVKMGTYDFMTNTFSGGSYTPGTEDTGSQLCGWPEFIALLNRLIKYVLMIVAPAIFAAMLIYGGCMYLFTPMSPESMGKAKSILTDAFVGWLLAAASWLIIQFLMQKLGYNEDIFPTFW